MTTPFDPTPPCCDVWPKILGAFNWFSFDDAPDSLTMPNIKHGGVSWRVNHCPSCGACIRNAIVTSDAVRESRSGLD